MKRLFALLIALSCALLPSCGRPAKSSAAQTAAAKAAPPAIETHTVSVNFNYDFSKNPGCPAGNAPTSPCVAEFRVYELDNGDRRLLFAFPAPPGARGAVKGIKGSSDGVPITSGPHKIGVAARFNTRLESDPNQCTTTLNVGS